MKIVDDERGIVMIAALGLMIALAGLSLAVATSGQMSSITGALSVHAANAFNTTDGAAHFALGDGGNFVPDMAPRTTDLSGGPAALGATVTATYLDHRALPGNLLIRTTDGAIRPAQFGQNEGLGRMYRFRLDAVKNVGTQGVDPWSRVQIEAAVPGPCADCGS